MKKTLKWASIALGGLIVIILLAAFLVPILFKDNIKSAIDKELAKSVNADVLFDIDKFSVSLFRHFPNITVSMEDLGVINREPFDGQILFATHKFEVEINLKEILFGDQIRVKGISLIQPVINIQVLEDGRANYDIAVPSEEETPETESGEFSFGIDHWKIVDADLVYDDSSLPFKLVMTGLNHSGSGDFTQAVFDLKTRTTADTVTVIYDGIEYLSNKRAEIDATISISENYSLYTFKENSAKVNDFGLSFNGWFKMNENDYGMDINFKSPENSFKSLLSLVPGMYTQNFGSIETKGDLSFEGFAKGTYSETQMPAFNIGLNVTDGMFKYPDLPTAVENINLDLLVDNKDGVIENTFIHVKQFHMDLGSNPFDATIIIENLRDYKMDANLMAKLNLGELTRMFPIEGLELKGNYTIGLKAKGIYDSIRNLIPAIDASMSLANGYVKSSEFPLPLQDLKFLSTVKNSSGKMAETIINVKDFSMNMDGETFTADLVLQDLVDYTWDLKAKGGIDLEKITKVFPVEGMSLTGKVKADLSTKGKYSDLQAERYDRLPTSGSASLTAFTYKDKDLHYDVTVSQANMSFDPRKIDLQKLDGTIGRSDFNINGSVLNYFGYVFGKGETIKGVVNFNSNLLDLNEFMTDTGETTSDTTNYGVVPVPKNIDFLLRSSIKSVRLLDFRMTNASGDILVKNGVANLNGLKFNMLGGGFTVSGTYDTRDINHPRYDFGLKIESLSIQQAANSFSMVQTYAPIAGLVNGNFSTDFKIRGELLQDMSPNMKTVNGGGLVKIAQASLTQSKIISGVTSLTKLDDTDNVSLKDVLLSAQISDGRLSVKPFDVKFGQYKTTVSGSTGLDRSIDYMLRMNVPAGKLGSQFQSFINANTGANNPTNEVPVTIAMGGLFDDPKFSLVADEQKEQIKEAVTNVAKEEGQKALQQAVKGTEAEKLVEGLLGRKDSTNVKSDSVSTTPAAEEVKKKVEEEAKQKIQNLLKKKN